MISGREEESHPGHPTPRLSSQGEADVPLLGQGGPGDLLLDLSVGVQQEKERTV